MVEDTLSGGINLIMTKSVSRFARKIVNSLTTIRKLKDNKVECYFEKNNFCAAETPENAEIAAFSGASWCLFGV